MIFIINQDGKRLCQDNCMRDHALFGSMSNCVKVYKLRGVAIRRAGHLTAVAQFVHKDETKAYYAIDVPNEYTIDASGDITRDIICTDKPGYVRIERKTLLEFIIKGGEVI